MQDEHRITELRYVKHPKCSIGGPDPDFPTARADGRHGLPIVWALKVVAEDSLQVAQWLQDAGVDLLEISGGTYSTQMREAYFVDFALAMREKVSIPLMVTGGFRRRDVMEQAIGSGGADLIGLGRPLCVMTDAPAQLLQGLAELPRFEAQLALFPTWLAFLNRIKTVRTIATFGVQYWYYAQLDALGNNGRAAPDMTVFAATRKVIAQQRRWVAARRRL